MLDTAVRKKTDAVFDDKLLLFAEGEALPFAYRSPGRENASYNINVKDIATIEKIGRFDISKSEKQIICRYRGNPAGYAVIAPLEDKSYLSEKAEIIIDYLRAAYSLELSAKDIEKFEEFTDRIAGRCGCLTDIYREESNIKDSFRIDTAKPDSAFIAISLPIIALMYRRISALRGFNFKITFAEGLPCLVFSAKVILSDKDSVIPEREALCSIAGTDELSFVHRLQELGEECDGGKLFKLSVGICPQTVDPRGILRAPEWKRHTDNILSKIDLDVPGIF